MDIKHLKYFISIIDCGSLSKAAEQLYVAQPALSHQMANLESDLKTKLLLRSTQGVKPTEAGKVFYRHARSLLRQVEQAREDVRRDSSNESGHIAVGLTASIAAVLATPLLEQVRIKYPNIHLQLFESESGYLTELLVNGRLDMAVLFRDTEMRGVTSLPLLDEDLFVYGDPKVVGAADVTIQVHRLDGVPMMLPSNTSGLRMVIERTFAQLGINLNVVADIDSTSTIISAVERGLGCSILPSSALSRRSPPHPAPILRLVGPALQRPVSLFWPSALQRISASIAVQQVLVNLVEELARGQTWTGAYVRQSARADAA